MSEIGPWVSRINGCEGHQCGLTYMVLKIGEVEKLSSFESAILIFLQKKHFFFALST